MYVYITETGKNDIRAKENGNTSAAGKKLADGIFTETELPAVQGDSPFLLITIKKAVSRRRTSKHFYKSTMGTGGLSRTGAAENPGAGPALFGHLFQGAAWDPHRTPGRFASYAVVYFLPSPRSRTTMRMGVPVIWNCSRIWFSR